MKRPLNCPPPVGGETIVILGAKERPGSVLFQCLSCRGYLPILTSCPEKALNLQRQALVSAFVVMDSKPVEEALEFCRRLRRINTVTPVIAILNDATRARGVELLEHGADHFEVQPLRIDALLGTLRSIAWHPLRQLGPMVF